MTLAEAKAWMFAHPGNVKHYQGVSWTATKPGQNDWKIFSSITDAAEHASTP